MMRDKTAAGLGSVVTLALLTACCGSAKSDLSAPGRISPDDLTTQPGNECRVRYQPNVVRVESSLARKTLGAVGDDGTLVFDGSAEAIGKLKPNQVLFIPGLALRKVKDVRKQDGLFLVHTANASIPEAIQEGTIRCRRSVDFAA